MTRTGRLADGRLPSPPLPFGFIEFSRMQSTRRNVVKEGLILEPDGIRVVFEYDFGC